jgi:hypothetical protein
MNLWHRYVALVQPAQMTSVRRRNRLLFYSGLIVLGITIWFLADLIPYSAG